MERIKRNKASEVQLSLEEYEHLNAAAKDHSLNLATYIRYAALQHTKYVAEFKRKSAEEYLKYQMAGEPLNRLKLGQNDKEEKKDGS